MITKLQKRLIIGDWILAVLSMSAAAYLFLIGDEFNALIMVIFSALNIWMAHKKISIKINAWLSNKIKEKMNSVR